MIKESRRGLYEYAVSVVSGGGVLFHGASVVTPQGAGLLFCGPSGCGKSTLALRLKERSWGIIHEEISVVLPEGERGYRVSPLPWIATEHPEIPFRQAVLKSIAFLERGCVGRTEYQPVSFENAVLGLAKNAWFFLELFRQYPACMRNIMTIAGRLPMGILQHSLSDDSVFDVLTGLQEKEIPV